MWKLIKVVGVLLPLVFISACIGMFLPKKCPLTIFYSEEIQKKSWSPWGPLEDKCTQMNTICTSCPLCIQYVSTLWLFSLSCLMSNGWKFDFVLLSLFFFCLSPPFCHSILLLLSANDTICNSRLAVWG